jgi:hypothetical protein
MPTLSDSSEKSLLLCIKFLTIIALRCCADKVFLNFLVTFYKQRLQETEVQDANTMGSKSTEEVCNGSH